MKKLILVSALLLAASNSHAVTADQFINEFTSGEKAAYVMASAEMAISAMGRQRPFGMILAECPL